MLGEKKLEKKHYLADRLESDLWGTSHLIHHQRALIMREEEGGTKPRKSKKVNCLALCLKASCCFRNSPASAGTGVPQNLSLA